MSEKEEEEEDCGDGETSNGKSSLNVNTNEMNGTDDDVTASKVKNDDVKRRFRKFTLPLFVANISLSYLFYIIMVAYIMGVIRTIERRFGLRSAQTGLIMSANDITNFVIIFVGYFGRKAHKPRIMCLMILLSVLSGFLMASPHFLLSSYVSPHDHQSAPRSISSVNSTGTSMDQPLSTRFCLQRKPLEMENTSNEVESGDDCGSIDNTEPSSSTVHPAFYIFVFAQLVNGIGGSAIVTFGQACIEEFSTGSELSLYIGIFTSMYALGPVFGMLLAALSLRFPENLLSSVEGSPYDESWIGCWWLGYVLCSFGLLCTSIPLWFFPNSSRITEKNPKEERLNEGKSKEGRKTSKAIREIKGFFRQLWHLLCNKAYVINLFSIVLDTYVIVGIFSNLVRYIEIHFLQSAFLGSMVAAVSAFVGAIGGVSGGLVMSKFRVHPLGATRMMMISRGILVAGIVVLLFLGCPQLEMAGQHDPEINRFTVLTDCNSHCACSTSPKSYSPICGSDNLTYFSACTAGCTDSANRTFLDCECISPGAAADNRFAIPGPCQPPCDLLIPFAVTLVSLSLLWGLSRVPSTIVSFKIVKDDERSFALGINSFAIGTFGYTPGPLIFGPLIDSACILWQTTCSTTGSCLLFDTKKFRYVTYGVTLLFQIAHLIFIFVLFLLVRKMKFPTEAQTATVHKIKSKEDVNVEQLELIEGLKGNSNI